MAVFFKISIFLLLSLCQDAAEQRKAQMRQADLSRQKNQNLSELEAEARDRAQYLLERANALRMEQEDEVKKLNEVDRTPMKSQTMAASPFEGCVLQRLNWLARDIEAVSFKSCLRKVRP